MRIFSTCRAVVFIVGSILVSHSAFTAETDTDYVRPKHCDLWYGKKPRIYLHGTWR